jgi:acetylornithine deacetylase/succinyl-diaminopimelate desuccinylase-like protein
MRQKNIFSFRALFFIPLLLLPLSAPAQETAPASAASSGVRLSTPDEIKSQFDAVPCKDKERLGAVRALFEKMGAKPEEIVIEKKGGVENLILRKAGTGDSLEKIVIGAHYDKAGGGCGAIDNWTGIVAIAHIYRTLKDAPTKKTLLFVAFGREEEGLIGSSQMAGAIKKEQVAEYCAMVNVDSLGLAMPQVADNMSIKTLEALAAAIAKEMEIPYAHATIAGGNSDSSSFNQKKIPAVTIHGMTNDWPKILHSSNDQAARINHASVYLGYRLAAAMVSRIDDSDCQAFREVKEKKGEKKEEKKEKK